MNNRMINRFTKSVAVLLVMMIMVSMLPSVIVSAFAATEDHPGYVTVTVLDELNAPVEGASVDFRIDSTANGEGMVSSSGSTDAAGCIEILKAEDFAAGDLTLTATVTKSGYKEAKIEGTALESADQNLEVKLEKATEITDVTVESNSFEYDGKEHPVAKVNGVLDTDDVTYTVNGEAVSGLINVKDVGSYEVTVTVNREGCEPFTKTVTTEVSKGKISLTVTPKTYNYDKSAHPVAEITGLEKGDVVTYSLNDAAEDPFTVSDPSKTGVPTITNVGKYTLKVAVERENYDDFEQVYTGAEITAADIEGVEVLPYDSVYDGKDHDAVEVKGCEDDDVIEYSTNDDEDWSEDVPQICEYQTGGYKITVRITRADDNYKQLAVKVTANIRKAGQSIAFNEYNNAEITKVYVDKENAENNKYDFSASGGTGIGAISYSLKNADKSADESDTDKIAEIDAAGEVTVKGPGCVTVIATKAESADYLKAEVKHNLVVVSKDDNLIIFNTEDLEYTLGTNDGKVPENKPEKSYKDLDNGAVTYSISGVDGLTIDEATGEVTVSDYKAVAAQFDRDKTTGLYATVTASKAVGTITTTVDQADLDGKAEDEYAVYFSNNKNWSKVYIHYWGGDSSTEFPGKEMDYNTTNHLGEDVYRAFIPKDTTGIVFSSGSSAAQTVDINNIYDNANYYPTTKIFGKYGVGSTPWTLSTSTIEQEVYPAAEAAYNITVLYADSPEEAYTIVPAEDRNALYNVRGLLNEQDTGWYIRPVEVTPNKDYTVFMKKHKDSGIEDPEGEAGKAVFGDDGDYERYIYLRNKTTGGVTAPIAVLENGGNLKIDTTAPTNLEITYSESMAAQIVKTVSLGFYKPSVTMTISAEDGTSGLSHTEWEYHRAADASVSNVESANGSEMFTEGKASKTLTGNEAEQYRGNVSFTVYDEAGNSATYFNENEIFAIDTISPALSVGYSIPDGRDVQNNWYYGINSEGQVKVRLVVTENNFFAENVTVSLIKEGAENPIEVTNVNWQNGSKTDEYYGDFVFGGEGQDGVYRVAVAYQDYAENKAVPDGEYIIKEDDTDRSETENHHEDLSQEDPYIYKSMPIIIDAAAPKIEFSYNEESQSTTVTITDVNFDPKDITITDSDNGKPICYYNDNSAVPGVTEESLTAIFRNGNWESDGNVHTFTYSGYTEGIYDFVINYKDLADNKADPLSTGEFMIDHTAPEILSISYNNEIDVVKTILGVITFNYYKYDRNVEVTFRAKDKVSGLKQFDWTYQRREGASEINLDKRQGTLKNITESGNSEFTATVVLPGEEKAQLMGLISVNATDNIAQDNQYCNQSEDFTDSKNGIVVDTVSPKVNVTFDKCSRVVGDRRFYGLDVDGRAGFTVTVDEANFFEEDVKVSVAKNGGEAQPVALSWSHDKDLHYGTYIIGGADSTETHNYDGDYVVKVTYKDHSENVMHLYQDEKLETEDEGVTEYQSGTITIDTIKPVIKVVYHNNDKIDTLTDNEDHSRDYFNAIQKATITITEHNFSAGEVDFSQVIGKDAAGNTLDIDNLVSKTEWTSKGDVHTITFTFSGDANYNFDLAYTDLAKNEAEDYHPDYFTVDTQAPVVTGVSYSTSVLDTVIGNISFGFYNAPVEVTVTAVDETSGVHNFVYNARLADGVSSVNAALLDQAVSEGSISYSDGRRTATLVFYIPQDALGAGNQFNGTIDFTAADRSRNEVKEEEDKRLVVDNISPTCSVSYNTPVNSVGGVSYYDGNINGTITIDEANFYSEDVVATYTMNGGGSGTLPVTWSDSSADIHIGTFTLTADGDYVITISYTDKSGNQMASYSSNQMTIDTKIEKPTYTINGEAKTENGGAYKEDALVGFNYSDQNFDTRTLTLTRTRFKDKDVDVTEKFVKETMDPKGGFGTFDIPKEVENDGIYILTITMTDKAKHTATSFVKFTINRFGSVYEYSDYLISLIKDGGQFVKIEEGETAAVTQDLIITEYNADKIVKDSLNILITRDGEPVSVKYTSKPEISDKVEVGDSGWYQYVYTIDKSNFAEDGVYKISLSSKDATHNESISVPENSIDAKGNAILDTMHFTVDTTAPEIRNIANLDKKIINAQEVNVKYSLVDIGGLKSVEVFVNDESVDAITDFTDLNDYSGEFVIDEKNEAQTVRLVVTDIAGNITDTKSDSFDPGEKFVFFDTVTISTNFFVRWFANKPLFFGTVGGGAAVLAALGIFIGLKAKKKKKA